MSPSFTEFLVEDAALSWLSDLCYSIASGQDLAPGEPSSERATIGDMRLGKLMEERTVLLGTLDSCLITLEPSRGVDAIR